MALLRKLKGVVLFTTITMVALLFRLPRVLESSRPLSDQRTETDGASPRSADASGLRRSAILSPDGKARRVGLPRSDTGNRQDKDDAGGFGTRPTVNPTATAAAAESKQYWKPCDSQCEELKSLLDSWPPDRPRAAFYYLTQRSRLGLLRQSLASVDARFNDRFGYPIIIFHEGDLTDRIPVIRNMTGSRLFFQLVSFAVPAFLPRPVPRDIACVSRVSYRHMCRFHARGVYEEPTVRALQYYWRLDDDSALLSDVGYDVFRFMQRRSLQYGYLWRHWDSLSCVEGLWEATRRYVAERNIRTEFFRSWKKGWLYYNNFEISSTKMWLSDAYQSYIDYIDRLGGIFYFRWGDAPLHGLAVSMFVPKNQTHLFHDIGYRHGWYRHEPSTNGTTPARQQSKASS